jgi:hypothetical protein
VIFWVRGADVRHNAPQQEESAPQPLQQSATDAG